MKRTARTIAIPHSTHEAEAAALEDKTTFGFWVYLMTDCILFATLFATYMVLHGNTYGGATSEEITNMPFVLGETLVLLTSSFTCGLGMLAAHRGDRRQVLAWLAVTFVLGATFLGMELTEFHHLVSEGNSWRSSGYLSAFFTLVGTHGLHITAGLLWILAMSRQLLRKGITPHTLRRLTLFGMFWHFLDIIWIFIFSIVYMMGAAL